MFRRKVIDNSDPARDKAVDALERMARSGDLRSVQLNGLGFSSCSFVWGNHTLRVSWWRDGSIEDIKFDGKDTPLTKGYVNALVPIVKQRIQLESDKALAAIVEGCPLENGDVS